MFFADQLSAIQSFITTGGPVVALLLVISVFALTIIILKLFQFAAQRVGSHKRARQALALWQKGDREAARVKIAPGKGVVSSCVATAMALAGNNALSKSDIEEEVARTALDRMHDLQKGFRALDAIAQIAPLLGLFGTVLGMIEAFQKLQSAGNAVDPSILAGGIWVALLTTAVGLAVAMPVSLALTWFESRLENERVAIETLAASVLSPNINTESSVSQPVDMTRLKHAH